MGAYIIVVLLLALWLLLMLNSGSIRITTDDNASHPQSYEIQGNCAQTQFGCCPDGVNSKMNFNGSNCPRYNRQGNRR